jgi:DNA-binding NarL/FixJ family response regulator
VGVDLAAYRIIQEALTNSTRHSGGANATVRLAYGDRALEVEVSDDQELVRAGFAALLDAEDDIEVVGEAADEEISRKIYVSPSTVKTHAAQAMTKLGARDRAQLVVFAYQTGLVRPDWQ